MNDVRLKAERKRQTIIAEQCSDAIALEAGVA